VSFLKFMILRFSKTKHFPVTWLTALCCLLVLCVSVVTITRAALTTETGSTPSLLHSELTMFTPAPQGPDLDYSNFKHTSQRHASLGCTSCHSRAGESAGTPRFPGHKACIDCHSNQFLTPNVPMCTICHTDVNSSNPPLKGFPTKFRESFNAKFDHAPHNVGSGRPPNGCADCHSRLGGRAAGVSIPVSISAHNQCYTCHTPSSKSSSGREIASCGVCHRVGGYSRTTTGARAFRMAFSHAKHGNAQKLSCADCHRLTPGLPQSRQVSAPAPSQHFPATRGITCLTCHNGKQSFGGEATFKDCRRCHTAASFRMPM